jgi:hypothetical protein
VGTFKSLAAGSSLNLSTRYDINNQLLNTFGDLNGLTFAVVGAQANHAPLNYTANTTWLTLARTDPNTQTTAPNRYTSSKSQTLQSDISGIAGDGSISGALVYAPNAVYGTGAGQSSATALIIPTTGIFAGNAYSSKYATGLGAHVNAPGPENTTSASFSTTPGSVAVSDLYEYAPGTPSAQSVFLGSFSLDNNGVLTFTAVPEPGTWAFLGLGAVALAVTQRNRKQGSQA